MIPVTCPRCSGLGSVRTLDGVAAEPNPTRQGFPTKACALCFGKRVVHPILASDQ